MDLLPGHRLTVIGQNIPVTTTIGITIPTVPTTGIAMTKDPDRFAAIEEASALGELSSFDSDPDYS